MKTADELRISDWSSDVCSSDLQPKRQREYEQRTLQYRTHIEHHADRKEEESEQDQAKGFDVGLDLVPIGRIGEHHPGDERSEEHTSELQSLMRISYAVFCLKKKQKNTPKKN